MKVEEILFAEKEGIINTINEYTREHFVRNYTHLLHELTFPEEKDKLKLICRRLISWYDDNYQAIMNNDYIRNKHEHKRSKELLNEMFIQLNELT